LKAAAVSVVLVLIVNGNVYTVDVLVGAVPSVVYRMVSSIMALFKMDTTCGEE